MISNRVSGDTLKRNSAEEEDTKKIFSPLCFSVPLSPYPFPCEPPCAALKSPGQSCLCVEGRVRSCYMCAMEHRTKGEGISGRLGPLVEVVAKAFCIDLLSKM